MSIGGSTTAPSLSSLVDQSSRYAFAEGSIEHECFDGTHEKWRTTNSKPLALEETWV
jgi:hypothetical protein